MLKLCLKQRYQREGRPCTEADMIAMAQEEWEALDWNKIYCHIIDCIYRRVKVVLDIEGERMKY